ncbi:MAG: protein kinase [Myxococcota bacterium]
MTESGSATPVCVGRYHLGPVIGRGGMGVVHRGHDPLLQRAVAIKIIDQRRGGPQLRESLRREAMVVARLDHPGIVPVHDLVEDDRGRLHVVMPLVPGRSLRELLAAGPLPLPVTIAVARRIAEVLRYSHARGVIHRDIKPDNVMIVEHGRRDLRIKLMDFGLAVAPGVLRSGEQGRVLGTVGYLSPEQSLGLPVDERSDLYALGVVIFECCTGRLPFEIESADPGADPGADRATDRGADRATAALTEPAPRLSSRVPSVPEALDALVAACLCREPAGRPASTEQVWATLETLAGGMLESLELPRGLAATRADRPTIDADTGDADTGHSTNTVEVGDRAHRVHRTHRSHRALGAILLMHGEYAAAQRAFDLEKATRGRSPTLAEEIDDQRWAANLAHKLARYDEAIECCDRALRRLGQRGIHEPETSAILHAWATIAAVAAGWLPTARDRVAVAEHFAAAVPPSPGRARAHVLALRARGNLLMAEARLEAAIAVLTQALEHAEHLDDPWELSIARFNLGHAHALAGQPGPALAHLGQATEDKRVIGDRWGLAYVHHVRAHVHFDRGELDQAEGELRQGAALADAIGDPKLVAMHEVDLGRVALDRGRIREATTRADVALGTARLRRAWAEQCGALMLKACLHRRAGRPDEGLAFARAALELAAPLELGVARAQALIELAHARAARGELALAADELDEAEALVTAWGNPIRQLEVDVARLEQAAAYGGEDPAPSELLESCGERAKRWGARLVAARVLAAQARSAWRMGDPAAARRWGQQACRAFDQCGASGLVAQLREALELAPGAD